MVHTSQDAVPCELLIACIFPCVHLYFFLIYRLLYIIIILEQNSIRIFYRVRIIKVMQQLSQLKLFCFT